MAVSSQTLTSLPNLPLDLIEQILYRLPVKLLIQLRCLCKSFNSLISDPKFAKKHLHISTKRHHLMVSSYNNLNQLIFFDSPINSIFSTFKVEHTQINQPSFLKKSCLEFCSCDGILCLTIDFGSILWNPSIGKYKILPNLENPSQKNNFFSLYSFGYDHFIDNYKIIVISSPCIKMEVSVLTLGTDYWRRIQDFPYPAHSICGSGIFVSGTVNWLVHDFSSSSNVIVSLDLKKESYQKLLKPELLKHDVEERCWILDVLKDCLCIFANYDLFLDVWVMKEYGNTDTWTKLYRVPVPNLEDRALRVYTKVLYISEDDQILTNFYDCGTENLMLAVYDSKNDTSNIPENQNIKLWRNPKVYIESMISPCY